MITALAIAFIPAGIFILWRVSCWAGAPADDRWSGHE